MGQAPSVSSEEATDAAFDLAWQDSAVGLLGRYNANRQFEAQGAKPLTPDEANAMYPGMDEPFRDPVNPYVAQMKYDTVQGRRELEAKIQQGPQDNWTKTKVFGAGMLAHMADPLEFGAGAIVGWGVGGLAARGAFGAGAASATVATQTGKATFSQIMAATAIESAGGALIENVAQEGIQKVVEGKEGIVDRRNNYEIATDILFGTVAAFGMSAVPKGLSKGLSMSMEGNKRFLRNTSPEADLVIARNIVAASEQGLVPDASPITKAIAQETNVPHKTAGYEYAPYKGGSLEGKKLFTATPSYDAGKTTALGNDYGFGVHVTDNPGVANAAAARGFSDGAGTMREVDIGELNPLNLDSPLAPDLALKINEILKKSGVDDVDLAATPASSILTDVRNAVDAGLLDETELDNVKLAIQEAGYDSLISDGRSMNGIDHLPHNHITLLDESKMSTKAEYAPNKEMVKGPNEKDVADMQKQAEAPRRLFQDDDYDKTRARVEEEIQPLMNSDIRKELETDIETLTALKDQGLVSEADIKKVQELIAQADDAHKALVNFAACVRNTG